MLVELPLEIWDYIFAIRRYDFELLVFKFKHKLQYNIFWKNKLVHLNFHFFHRVITKKSHQHRSGHSWGVDERWVLTFILNLKRHSTDIEYYIERSLYSHYMEGRLRY